MSQAKEDIQLGLSVPSPKARAQNMWWKADLLLKKTGNIPPFPHNVQQYGWSQEWRPTLSHCTSVVRQAKTAPITRRELTELTWLFLTAFLGKPKKKVCSTVRWRPGLVRRIVVYCLAGSWMRRARRRAAVEQPLLPTHSWTGPLPQHFLPLRSQSQRSNWRLFLWASRGSAPAFTPHDIILTRRHWNAANCSSINLDLAEAV